jgi:hypothetical protein
MKKYSYLLLLLTAFLLGSCDWDDQNPNSPLEGEIWVSVNRDFLRLNDPGTALPAITNGYEESVRSVSMRRQLFDPFQGNMSIRIQLINFELRDSGQISVPSNNVIVNFSPATNVIYTGRDGECQLIVDSVEGEVIKGRFSGRVRNVNNPSQSFLLSDGQFHIRLIRQ